MENETKPTSRQKLFEESVHEINKMVLMQTVNIEYFTRKLVTAKVDPTQNLNQGQLAGAKAQAEAVLAELNIKLDIITDMADHEMLDWPVKKSEPQSGIITK